jgi:NuA3 HAT complex component NTO1
MGGSHSESLFRQQLPTKLPKVEAWPIHLAEPEPRGVEETLYERFGYNDIDEVFQPTTTYSRWVQPSQDELAKQVEYDMNDVDKAWLDRVNSERRKDGLDGISYEFFEILMDKLEKEWFDLSKHFPKPASNLTVDDSKCTICDDGECEASNAIVFCDGCNLAVHQGECPAVDEGGPQSILRADGGQPT